MLLSWLKAMCSERFLLIAQSSPLKLSLLCMIKVFYIAFLNQMKMKFDPYVRRIDLEMRYRQDRKERTHFSREKLRETEDMCAAKSLCCTSQTSTTL